jgi:hypothetical protein
MASNKELYVEPLQDSEYFPSTRSDATQTSSSSTGTWFPIVFRRGEGAKNLAESLKIWQKV